MVQDVRSSQVTILLLALTTSTSKTQFEPVTSQPTAVQLRVSDQFVQTSCRGSGCGGGTGGAGAGGRGAEGVRAEQQLIPNAPQRSKGADVSSGASVVESVAICTAFVITSARNITQESSIFSMFTRGVASPG